MSTRSRPPRRLEGGQRTDDAFGYESGLEADWEVTDEDIEAFLRRGEEPPHQERFLNLPTAVGLATVGVGAAYLLQELGLFAPGFDFSQLVGPWLIGVLIILAGFAVLSWSPNRKRRQTERRRQQAERQRTQTRRPRSEREAREPASVHSTSEKKLFARSRTDRKVAGVCGGIGEYFGIDPTIIRIAFVVALIASGTMALPLYLLLAWIMPKPEQAAERPAPRDVHDDERVVIIRG